MGECVVTKQSQIQRHNAIVKKIQEKCIAQGYKVAREQPYVDQGGQLLEPDLVIKKNDRAFIANVTVSFENGDSVEAVALRGLGRESAEPGSL